MMGTYNLSVLRHPNYQTSTRFTPNSQRMELANKGSERASHAAAASSIVQLYITE